MTRQRNDSHSTEFGIWLRKQGEICSSLGFVATNLDFIWRNYKTKQWMLLEEKRFGYNMTYAQRKIFQAMDKCLLNSEGYMGFHFIKFERTGPHDGRMFIDGRECSCDDLIRFLQFKMPRNWYKSLFQKGYR